MVKIACLVHTCFNGINDFQKAEKAWKMSRSKFKAILIVFFDIQGIVTTEWVPSGHTVNQQYYT